MLRVYFKFALELAVGTGLSMHLKSHLAAIPDHRRAQGRMYDLGHLLLFSVLAVVSGATSYRKIQRFMVAHRERLNELCALQWKRAPAHNSIRYALHGLDPGEMEAAFRQHAAELDREPPPQGCIAMGRQEPSRQFRSFRRPQGGSST